MNGPLLENVLFRPCPIRDDVEASVSMDEPWIKCDPFGCIWADGIMAANAPFNGEILASHLSVLQNWFDPMSKGPMVS